LLRISHSLTYKCDFVYTSTILPLSEDLLQWIDEIPSD
jgi:hypothetical protein